MTLTQFKQLRSEEQAYMLSYEAVLLESIKEPDGDYTLFQIHGFYCEIFCPEREKHGCSVCYFEDPDLLYPYLVMVNINDVYQLLGYGKFH